MENEIERKILGPKGRIPIKTQRNPRKKTAKSAMFHFVNDYHDGDEEAAKASIESYKIGSHAFKESILTTWININGMPLRMAKELFNIGAHKYTRLKDQRPKLKPGGPRANHVS